MPGCPNFASTIRGSIPSPCSSLHWVSFFVSPSTLFMFFIVLHPYYKLDYIKLSWGGAEEQAIERREGNPFAKNWQDEALKIVEKTVSVDS